MIAPAAGAEHGPLTPPQTGLRWYWQVAVVCAAVALVFSRQPDALLHPQFFAEDGTVWYANAYNHGWFKALFQAQDGYFQTLPRLAAALALFVPLSLAPAVMNLVGLFFQVLPVPLLLSSRLSSWGSLPLRAMLAITYLALPNSAELNVSIEEGQWHLALAACLVLLCVAPGTRAWKLFDVGVLILCGLTGPFAILLLPIAGVLLWMRHESLMRWYLGVLTCCAAIQLYALLTMPRDHWPLGASLGGLMRIVAGQVYVGAILGSNGLSAQKVPAFIVLIFVTGTLLLLYCFLRASAEWKLFLLFSAIVLAAALAHPFTPRLRPGSTSWSVLAGTPGIRYWFFPTLAFAWTIVWYLLSPPAPKVRRLTGAALMALMLIGIARDWRIPPRKDLRFADCAQAFEASPSGTVMVIPENPDGWTLRLVKR
jgi:hypothetical protein